MAVNQQQGFGMMEAVVAIAMVSIVSYGVAKITLLKQAQLLDNNAHYQANVLIRNLAAMMHTLSFDYQAFTQGLYTNGSGEMIGPYTTQNNRYNEQEEWFSIPQMANKYCNSEGCSTLQQQADDDIATLYVLLDKLTDAELSISCDDALTSDDTPCSLGSIHHISLHWLKTAGDKASIELNIAH